MQRLFFLLIFLVCFSIPFSQCGLSKNVPTSNSTPESIIFSNSKDDVANAIIQNFQGNLIVVGNTELRGGREQDIFLVEMTPKGKELFPPKTFGSEGKDFVNDIIQTNDGGYIVGGSTVLDKLKEPKGFLFKLDEFGDVLWAKSFNYKEPVDIKGLQKDQDGNIIATGFKGSELLVLKISTWGELLWEKTYSFKNMERAIGESVALSINNNIVITGSLYGKQKNEKALFLKIYPDGKVISKQSFENAKGSEIVVGENDNYFITGTSYLDGNADILFLKLNSKGEKIIRKNYGGQKKDVANSLIYSLDDHLFISGYTYSNKRGTKFKDLFLLKLDLEGQEVWGNKYYQGGGKDDFVNAMLQLNDGDVAMVGGTTSPKKARNEDAWLVIKDEPFNSSRTANPKITIQNFEFKNNRTDKKIGAEERGYIEFEIINNGEDISFLDLEVKEKNNIEGLSFPPKLKIKHLGKGQQRKIQIPIKGEENLKEGIVDFQIELNQNLNSVLSKSIPIQIKSESKPLPQLVIEDFQIPSKEIPLGDSFEVKIKLKNIGKKMAEGTQVNLDLPSNIYLEDENLSQFYIPKLLPSEEKEFVIRLLTDPVFISKSASFSFSARDNITLGVKQSSTVFFEERKIISEKETLEEPDFGFRKELNITSPLKPFDYKSSEKKFSLDFQIKSNQPIEVEETIIFINDIEGHSFLGTGQCQDKITPYNGFYIYDFCRDFYFNQVGNNEIFIQVRTKENRTFRSKNIYINYQPNPPNLYVLSIGVPFKNLKYTAKDALDFGNLMEGQKGALYKNIKVDVINTNENTEVTNLKKKIDSFCKITKRGIQPHDVVIIYISSHGKIQNNKFYIKGSDTDEGEDIRYDPEISAINFEKIVLNKIDMLTCKKYVFLDACRKITMDSEEGGEKFDEEDLPEMIQKMLEGQKGLRVLYSTDEDEYSYEHNNWQNGAFTHALKEALTNQKVKVLAKGSSKKTQIIQADMTSVIDDAKEPDGVLTLIELFNFLSQRVPYKVNSTFKEKKYQRPQLLINDESDDHNFPIFRILK